MPRYSGRDRRNRLLPVDEPIFLPRDYYPLEDHVPAWERLRNRYPRVPPYVQPHIFFEPTIKDREQCRAKNEKAKENDKGKGKELDLAESSNTSRKDSARSFIQRTRSQKIDSLHTEAVALLEMWKKLRSGEPDRSDQPFEFALPNSDRVKRVDAAIRHLVSVFERGDLS